jgi:arginyl-tRNA synthetase
MAFSQITKNKSQITKLRQILSLLTETEELNLIDQLSQLEQILLSIVSFDEYPVHYLTFYSIEIAKKFHAFYDKCRVIDEENLELTAARLELVKATQIVLGIVMRDLIGIDAPERM